MRPIDADALIEKCGGWYVEEGTESGFIGTLKNLLATEPTVQPEPKAQLSKEGTTKDAISRQAVLDTIVQCTNCGDEDTLREYVLKHSLDNGWTGGILEALDAVKDLPPVQPEPKEGHWIPHESPDGGEQYECSRCGVLWEFTDGTPEDNEAYFCPKCGTKMKGERQK